MASYYQKLSARYKGVVKADPRAKELKVGLTSMSSS
jgi:hypothetical protein